MKKNETTERSFEDAMFLAMALTDIACNLPNPRNVRGAVLQKALRIVDGIEGAASIVTHFCKETPHKYGARRTKKWIRILSDNIAELDIPIAYLASFPEKITAGERRSIRQFFVSAVLARVSDKTLTTLAVSEGLEKILHKKGVDIKTDRKHFTELLADKMLEGRFTAQDLPRSNQHCKRDVERYSFVR